MKVVLEARRARFIIYLWFYVQSNIKVRK